MNDFILRLPQVRKITGLSRSTLYVRIAQGTFPKQIQLGEKSVGWLDSEISEWLDEQIKKSREEV